MPRADDAWEGGYITRDGRGRPTFYIRRQVSGVRYDVSTRARNARAAFEQLKRFSRSSRSRKCTHLESLQQKLVGKDVLLIANLSDPKLDRARGRRAATGSTPG